MHRAPEVLNTYSRHRADPDDESLEKMDLSKQGSFETGVMLYWMATQRDALPDYPAAYGPPGGVFFSTICV